MSKPNPIEIQKYLEGIDFPATKDDIIETAQNNDANQEIFDILEKLPKKDYHSPTDISQEIGRM
jgi:hypothetical protein